MIKWRVVKEDTGHLNLYRTCELIPHLQNQKQTKKPVGNFCGTNSNMHTALSEITNEGQFFFSIYKTQAAEYFSKAKHSYIFIQTHFSGSEKLKKQSSTLSTASEKHGP